MAVVARRTQDPRNLGRAVEVSGDRWVGPFDGLWCQDHQLLHRVVTLVHGFQVKAPFAGANS